MDEIELVKDYALKNYKTLFTKTRVHRDLRGKVTKREVINIDPIVKDCGTHFTVSSNKDASPIILSKTILG